MAKRRVNPADFIRPLEMNNLLGRMLYLPSKKNKQTEIMFVYGQHSSIERWWGLAKYLNNFGAVTVPDLPGFGGMESFHKIGLEPTIDNFADYLASFMKMRYRNKKVVVIGLSFGFVVVTRMLQKYPDLTKNVRLLVSLVGFSHADDFVFSRPRLLFYKGISRVLSKPLPAFMFRYIGLNAPVLSLVYQHTYLAKSKFERHMMKSNKEVQIMVETWLWQNNDIRTHAQTISEFLNLNNCLIKVDSGVWHVTANNDQYFNHQRVEQHLRVIFKEVNIAQSKLNTHAPSIIADEKEVAAIMPLALKRALNQL